MEQSRPDVRGGGGLGRSPVVYALPLALVLLATAARAALDTILADDLTWSFYYIPVLVAAVYAGAAMGWFTILMGGVAGILLFNRPDGSIAPDAADLIGFGVYVALGGAIVFLAARLRRSLDDGAQRQRALEHEIEQRRRAEFEKERLNRELQRRVCEFDLLWEHTDVGIAFAHDPQCREISANPAFLRMLRLPAGSNISLHETNAPNLPFRLFRDGRELLPHEMPMQHAAVTGQTVIDQEIEIRHADGGAVIALVSAVPMFDGGEVRGCFGTAVDITERKRLEEALRRGEARERARAHEIETVMEAVPAIVFIADDPQCRTIRTNRLGRELLRLADGANVSKSAPANEAPTTFRVLQNGVDIPPEQLPVQRAARGETIRDFEEDLLFADGTLCHWLGNAVPLRDEEGRPRGAVAAFVDITARKRAEDALRLADQRKDEFIAALGHQLRNPLAPIKSGIELIRKHLNDERRRAWALEVIDRQLHQLSRIVDDLLELARVASGRVTLKREPTALQDIVSQAVETARPLIARKGQRLHVELAEEELGVDVDPARIVQVLSNLLNNASRHTPRGGTIAVSAHARAGRAHLRVRDSGDGIDPCELPRIFEMYRHAPRVAAEGGLGVGLAFARRIVELHGGTIGAHSAGLGKGAEFYIELPLRAQARAQAPHELPAPPRRRVPPRRILMIDDNRDAADSMAELLRMQGHEVRCVYRGREAEAAALEFRPDLALLDIDMADMNGYELARRFRADPRLYNVVLAALTGYGRAADKEQALAAGFDAHFTKPADAMELLDYIASAAPADGVRPVPAHAATRGERLPGTN